MYKQLLILALLGIATCNSGSPFDFNPGQKWWLVYGATEVTDGTNTILDDFEEGFNKAENLPNKSQYLFAKGWGKDAACVAIQGDGLETGTAYAADGIPLEYSTDAGSDPATEDQVYNNYFAVNGGSEIQNHCYDMQNDWSGTSFYALRPVNLHYVKCYELTKDFTPLSDNGKKHQSCYLAALKEIGLDNWQWLKDLLQFTDKLDVQAIDVENYDEAKNTLKVGTVGAYAQCVRRNNCWQYLTDYVESETANNGRNSEYPEYDSWYWDYHASIVTALGGADCSSVKTNQGTDPLAALKGDEIIKCIDTFRQTLLLSDRKAVQCLTECAQGPEFLPKPEDALGPIDGEASDDLQDYQNLKKQSIERFLNCVNKKNLYQFEVHPRHVAEPDQTVDYPLYDQAWQNSLTDSTAYGIAQFAEWAAHDQQARTCFRVDEDCIKMRYWLKYGYQHSDYELIGKCVNDCLQYDETFAQTDPGYTGTVGNRLSRNEKEDFEVQKCYQNFLRNWHVHQHEFYDGKGSNSTILSVIATSLILLVSLIL